jgi:hypothetical protein
VEIRVRTDIFKHKGKDETAGHAQRDVVEHEERLELCATKRVRRCVWARASSMTFDARTGLRSFIISWPPKMTAR